MKNEDNFKRMCSFYVSDLHLVTMLLPHLSKKLEKGESITTFLEKDIKDEMDLLLSKINIKESLKNEIKKINWNNSKDINLEDVMKSLLKEKNNIIVVGSCNYIELINNKIKNYISKNKSINVSEIDAYKLEEGKNIIKDIVSKYESVLNTAGEKSVHEFLKIK